MTWVNVEKYHFYNLQLCLGGWWVAKSQRWTAQSFFHLFWCFLFCIWLYRSGKQAVSNSRGYKCSSFLLERWKDRSSKVAEGRWPHVENTSCLSSPINITPLQIQSNLQSIIKGNIRDGLQANNEKCNINCFAPTYWHRNVRHHMIWNQQSPHQSRTTWHWQMEVNIFVQFSTI